MEASIVLSHAVIILATSPKSNSAYTAIKAAMNDVENINIGDIENEEAFIYRSYAILYDANIRTRVVEYFT